MDELAHKLKVDPLELRLINYAELDPESGKLFSSKARGCYRLGAEKFGWKIASSNHAPCAMAAFSWAGGTATGVWGAFQRPASAKIVFRADGTAHVTSATSESTPARTQ